MPAIVTDAKHVTFINTFRCEPSSQDEVVRLNIEIIDPVAAHVSRVHLGGHPPQH